MNFKRFHIIAASILFLSHSTHGDKRGLYIDMPDTMMFLKFIQRHQSRRARDGNASTEVLSPS